MEYILEGVEVRHQSPDVLDRSYIQGYSGMVHHMLMANMNVDRFSEKDLKHALSLFVFKIYDVLSNWPEIPNDRISIDIYRTQQRTQPLLPIQTIQICSVQIYDPQSFLNPLGNKIFRKGIE